jgi:putative hemolysin
MQAIDSGRVQALASFCEERGNYRVRFAQDAADRLRVQRLRFDVFARELDQDPLDDLVDHLLVSDRRTDECVGTYRLATREQVGRVPGFYTRRQFEMGRLDPRIEAEGVELGRACVAVAHRSRGVLQLLLRGIGAYLGLSGKRFLFGCGSIMMKDPREAEFVRESVEREGWLDPALVVEPTAGYRLPHCEPPPLIGPELPALLHAYCAIGARLAPSPAWDADFKSLDFFVLLDLERIDPRSYARYCGIRR